MKRIIYLTSLFLLFFSTGYAQYRKIEGIVKDEEGNPLIGAGVSVLGTDNGTTTSSKGIFTLEVNKDNAVLKISYVGYETKEVPILGKDSLTIVLVSESVGLNEVVAIGYGTQKKVDLT